MKKAKLGLGEAASSNQMQQAFILFAASQLFSKTTVSGGWLVEGMPIDSPASTA